MNTLHDSAAAALAERTLHACRDAYLDLMVRCLVNTIYEDDPQDPWTGRIYSEGLRQGGRDWPSKAHSMIGVQRMQNLRFLCEQVLIHDVPGDFIETGVWRGGACILMRSILKAYASTSRTVWVADSFEGLPKPSADRYQADAGDQHHAYPELAISLEQVQSNFDKYGLLDHQVRFLKGWFRDTLHQVPAEKFAILRLDGDMYESTMDALTALYDKLSIGGYIIIDDYGAIEACRRAVHEFRDARGITEGIHNIDGIGVYWKKRAEALTPDRLAERLTGQTL